ncbi:MAG: class I SAM-dependent methyltransferase [Promethearchaeota archaeon]
MSEISKLVEEGYNKIANAYYAHRDLNKFISELDRLIELLPKRAHILDVGCGAGIPTSKYLAERGFEISGIDISETMLNLARENVPNGTYTKMDMNEIKFDENTFDALVSVYALFHVRKKKYYQIFKKFYEVLKPGGILMINTGINESEGVSSFFGVPMLWSNHDPKTTLELVKKAGFSIIFEGILERGGEFQYWIYGKKETK